MRDLYVDVRGSDPGVGDEPFERGGAYLIVRASGTDGRVDLEVVDDHLEDALDSSCVVRRGDALWERCHSPAQDDGPDFVDRHGDQLGMFDARVAP